MTDGADSVSTLKLLVVMVRDVEEGVLEEEDAGGDEGKCRDGYEEDVECVEGTEAKIHPACRRTNASENHMDAQ